MPGLIEEFVAFEAEPPEDLQGDPIWRLPAFRLGLFLSRVAREDSVQLRRLPQHWNEASQLRRAVDAIKANITEGYGRLSGKDRARYYEIALCSARESREWYRDLATTLGRDHVRETAILLTRVIRILTKAIPAERAGSSEQRIRRAAERARGPKLPE
jgi:four helix bundle protein